MKRRVGIAGIVLILVATVFALSVFATTAELYFSSDKNGQNRVTNIQEGDEIWIVVIDNDQNTDCDVRDKMSPDLKIMDPKTGAYIVWEADPEAEDPTEFDYLDETGADTGVFVSHRAFQIGTRESFAAGTPELSTHIVDRPVEGATDDFMWGHYWYGAEAYSYADNRGWIAPGPVYVDGLMVPVVWPGEPLPPSEWTSPTGWDEYLIGRFENMDTLVGLYADPNDPTDIALGLMKIIDVEASIAWNQEIYKDAQGSATITVVDPDENLNCNEVEYVPVFIIVNPGSWNPQDLDGKSPTNFCMLLKTGGVDPENGVPNFAHTHAAVYNDSIRWYNIYNSRNADSLYYIQYDPTLFATTDVDGVTSVLFYAQETGANTGIFQLNINNILADLGFQSLNVRDVLVAYYLDPNDFDDFKLTTAYIEEKNHSITSFTDENRADKDLFWIGRDPVYVQVIDANANVDPCCPEQIVVHICDPHGEDDAEWLILDEGSSNSSVFFTFNGTQLWPVWDALGVGLANSTGGFQLQLDNWKIEAFNEDDMYARYNDVYYGAPTEVTNGGNVTSGGMATLGDGDPYTSFPPFITRTRVANDVGFDLMSVADTQVYDGSTVNMHFLDRQGNRVSGYANSDCVFIKVIDPDQDEDQYRRERIDAYWDGGQNVPFGPQALNEFLCPVADMDGHWHYVNWLLGDTNIFNDGPADSLDGECWFEDWDGDHAAWPKLYVLNPGSGRWAAVDLLETGPSTGNFVSVICIDLASVYECVPNLDVWPGDTIIAVYQDPSNHSDSAWISIKVGIGGGGTPPSQQSTTLFVDANGDEVASYNTTDPVYVRVIDPSHAGATLLASAVEIEGVEYDVTASDCPADIFMSEGLDLDLTVGQALTATYTDPTDLTDTSSDTITIVSSVLAIDSFYASPNPFEIDVTFSYVGTGVASLMTAAIYDLSGQLLWEIEGTNVSQLTWDGTTGVRCLAMANGPYLYVVTATDGTNTFSHTGTVFVNR